MTALPPVGNLVNQGCTIPGQSPTVYDQFEREVRREYWFVPRKRFVAARAGILRGFLAQPRIFRFDSFVDRYEARARENLGRAVEALQR